MRLQPWGLSLRKKKNQPKVIVLFYFVGEGGGIHLKNHSMSFDILNLSHLTIFIGMGK